MDQNQKLLQHPGTQDAWSFPAIHFNDSDRDNGMPKLLTFTATRNLWYLFICSISTFPKHPEVTDKILTYPGVVQSAELKKNIQKLIFQVKPPSIDYAMSRSFERD